jgi:prepilin-type N-terminal cleavage/methylation domain-containing protein
MKKGFTIIEVVIAVFLSSLISLSLYQLLRTASSGVTDIITTIDVDMPVSGFYNQVEKDVTGMFAPFSSLQKFAKKDFEAKKEKDSPFKQNDEKKKEIKLDNEPIEQVFVLDAHGDSFFWSFITTGGIEVLDADGNIMPTSFVRRVAYLLEPDPVRAGVHRLMYRFSGSNLDLGHIKSPTFSPSYELISMIKKLSIELTIMEVVEKAPQKDKEGKEDEKVVKQASSQSVNLKEWKTDDIWDKYKTLIPAYVKLSGIRVDTFGAEYPFEIACKVYAYSPYVEKEKTLFEALEDIAKKLWKK